MATSRPEKKRPHKRKAGNTDNTEMEDDIEGWATDGCSTEELALLAREAWSEQQRQRASLQHSLEDVSGEDWATDECSTVDPTEELTLYTREPSSEQQRPRASLPQGLDVPVDGTEQDFERRGARSKVQRRHRRNDGRLPDSRQASQVGRWTLRQPNSRRRRAVADPAAHAAAACRVVRAMAPWEHARNPPLAEDACRRRAHDARLS